MHGLFWFLTSSRNGSIKEQKYDRQFLFLCFQFVFVASQINSFLTSSGRNSLFYSSNILLLEYNWHQCHMYSRWKASEVALFVICFTNYADYSWQLWKFVRHLVIILGKPHNVVNKSFPVELFTCFFLAVGCGLTHLAFHAHRSGHKTSKRTVVNIGQHSVLQCL